MRNDLAMGGASSESSAAAANRPRLLPAAAAIAATTIASFSFWFTPKLVADDWPLIVESWLGGSLKWFTWPWHRPLDRVLAGRLIGLFGLDVRALHVANLLLIAMVAFAIFLLVRELFPDASLVALPAALLAMLYPADFTLTWLQAMNNRLAWLLVLIGMYCLLRWTHEGHNWRLVAAWLLLFVPLWIYEGAFGTIAAWCVFVALSERGAMIRRRLWALSPLVLLALFALLRVFALPLIRGPDPYVLAFHELTASVVLERLPKIYVLVKAWVRPTQEWLVWLGFHWVSGWSAAVLIAAVSGLIGLAVLGILRLTRVGENGSLGPAQQARGVRSFVLALPISACFAVVGYFPSICVFAPNLEDLQTRVNMYSIAAASVALASLGCLVTSVLTLRRTQQRVLVWALLVPFVAIGWGVEWRSQQLGSEAWQRQERLWQSLFQLAPDFCDRTTVVFMVRGYGEPRLYEPSLLQASWEASAALRVLYENRSLGGEILFPDATVYSESGLTPTGLMGFESKTLVPYSQVVIIDCDERARNVEILAALPGHPEYNPSARIITVARKQWRYRYLVGVR